MPEFDIDIFENLLQIAVLVVCIIISVSHAVKYGSRSWTILSFFYGCWIGGDIYWLACLVFYGDSPQISVISDLSWYAAQIFLYLLIRHLLPPEKVKGTRFVPWLGPLFTFGMAVFFMFWGEILANLIYAALMGLLLYASIRRITDKEVTGRKLILPVTVLVYVLLIYGLWVASCFWDETVPLHPYYVFDFLITASFPFFLLGVRKAVTA